MSGPGLQGIHAVGGVVPPGLLARIQAGELKDPAGLAPASYHLIGRETPRDAASRAWSYLRSAWTAWREYKATQPPGSPGIAAARERWLLVLLRELGYGQVPALPGGYIIDDRHYPVSHAWQHVPIHLLGPGVDLNHRNPDVSGAARAPQAMLQELLNRSDSHLWGILSNGLRLRLLRDSTALAGSAYLEFDLETIFDGELYPEFLLMWQLCHVSRLEKRPTADDANVATPAGCWLEIWRGEAAEAGTRMLDRLRDGVAAAITALGTGFIRHPANRPLAEALRDGTLSTAQYHRALLRLVYRLLFCFVAEDRDALLHPNATAQARDRYNRYFSTARLRRLSRTRAGSPHPDLWQAQVVVLRALGGNGHSGLGLPALAGLFDPDPHLPAIDKLRGDPLLGCALSNEDLLTAVRKLAWVALPGQRVQPVDYRNLGAEELGSVYESLLELVPRVDLADRTFLLVTISGNDRKTTGSYYTPPSLVSALLDTALDPLLDEATAGASDLAHAETRLLALTVCDPACGSGHFLVAAARRIARRLAQVRSGDDEPTPTQVQQALREVVGHCIYGVDLNDLAAELAKVSLWMEALEPGKPLGFLDARIRIGNSLLGVTPAQLYGPMPDEAFKELEGDDKRTAAAARKRNRAQAPGKEGYAQDLLFVGGPAASNVDLAAQRAALLNLPDDVDSIRAQANRWEQYEQSSEYRAQRFHADIWCAAFVWPMPATGTDSVPEPPTNAIMRTIADDPLSESHAHLVDFTEEIAARYRFLHWHIEFPEIFHVDQAAINVTPHGWIGGFSCVLGNPPWEQVELKEKEFFAANAPDIAVASTSARKKLIAALKDSVSIVDRSLYGRFIAAKRRIQGESLYMRASGLFPLTGVGRINTYAVFAEVFRSLIGAAGRSGTILPTGIATDDTTKMFFNSVLQSGRIVSLYDFENHEKKFFNNVDSRYKFCLMTLSGHDTTQNPLRVAFFLRDPGEISVASYSYTPSEIAALNPNTGTSTICRTHRDLNILLGIHRRVPILFDERESVANSWNVTITSIFNMSSSSRLFHNRAYLEADGWMLFGNIFRKGSERMLPLYEGKMIHHFDHRWATYGGSDFRDAVDGEKSISEFRILPRYWVAERDVAAQLKEEKIAPWLLGVRGICRNTDERSLICSALPFAAAGDSLPVILGEVDGKELLAACLSSLVLDFAARQKVGGMNLNYFIIKQLPVPTRQEFERGTSWDRAAGSEWWSGRVLELNYTSGDMTLFAKDLGDEGPPFAWEPERRESLRAELDAGFFHLYGISRGDVEYILDTFTIMRSHDERRYGEYRTQRLILEVFDAMQHAIDIGKPYTTIVDPPPGHGVRHPARDEALA